MVEMSCQRRRAHQETCLVQKNKNFPKYRKKQYVKKDRKFQKQRKANNFQGRKVQENMPDIKQENLVKEGAISILDWRIQTWKNYLRFILSIFLKEGEFPLWVELYKQGNISMTHTCYFPQGGRTIGLVQDLASGNLINM